MRKLITILVILICSLLHTATFAQNLVTNGGFETYTSLPNSLMDWSFCVGWNNVNMNSGSWPYATPDYYHTSGTGDASLPNSKYATLNPHTGNACIGLYSKHSSQLNARDYMARQMSAPLTVGVTYTISWWMTSGAPGYYYGGSCNNMGIQLSMAPLTQVQHENTGGTPQAEITTEVWSPTWVFFSFTYVATSAHQYITIGNFRTDAATSSSVRSAANYPSGVYYFIDDVIVEPAGPLPIELLSFEAVKEGNHVKLDWITESEINNDYFTVERSTDVENWEAIGQVNGAGNSSQVLNYSMIDDDPIHGVSYYRLKQTDFNGEYTYSSVRTVYFKDPTDVFVYPNPATDIISIRGDAESIAQFKLFNTLGQEVNYLVSSSQGYDENTLIINVANLAKGMYILKTPGNAVKVYKE